MKPRLVPKSKPTRDQVRKAAERFLLAQGLDEAAGYDVDRSEVEIRGCAAHLHDNLGLDRPQAQEAAMFAWAEVVGRQVRCYVDLDASSPHLLFLVDPVAGRRHPIPVVDLVRLLGPRGVA